MTIHNSPWIVKFAGWLLSFVLFPNKYFFNLHNFRPQGPFTLKVHGSIAHLALPRGLLSPVAQKGYRSKLLLIMEHIEKNERMTYYLLLQLSKGCSLVVLTENVCFSVRKFLHCLIQSLSNCFSKETLRWQSLTIAKFKLFLIMRTIFKKRKNKKQIIKFISWKWYHLVYI